MGETRAGVGVGLAATIHVMTGPMVSSGPAGADGGALCWASHGREAAHAAGDDGNTGERTPMVWESRQATPDRCSTQGEVRRIN